MSHSLHLAGPQIAAAEPLDEDRQHQPDDDKEHSNDARSAHLVRLETSDVHVQGEDAGGVTRAALGENPDQIEVDQRSDKHQSRGRNDGVLQLRQSDREELPKAPCSVDLSRFIELLWDLPDPTLVEEGVERYELPGDDEDDGNERQRGVAQPILCKEWQVE